MGFFEFLQNNFKHVLPIILCGGFALAVIIERTRALYQVYPMKDTEGFFKQITRLVLAGKTKEAKSLCEQHKDKPNPHGGRGIEA